MVPCVEHQGADSHQVVPLHHQWVMDLAQWVRMVVPVDLPQVSVVLDVVVQVVSEAEVPQEVEAVQ